MNTLEFLLKYGGMVQLEGVYVNTTESTRKYDKVVDHTRLNDRGYVVRKPHVSSKKAGLNLTGLDTSTRLPGKEYGWRTMVVASNFSLRQPIKVNKGGWKVMNQEDFDSIFPILPKNLVEYFLEALKRFRVSKDYEEKAKSKLPSIPRTPYTGEQMYMVETPFQHWEIILPIDKPRYSWAGKTVEDIQTIISSCEKEQEEIKKEIIEKTGFDYLNELDADEVIRSIELGVLEKGLLVPEKVSFISNKKEMEKTSVTAAEFQRLISDGKISIEEYTGRDGTTKTKGIMKEYKVTPVEIPGVATKV